MPEADKVMSTSDAPVKQDYVKPLAEVAETNPLEYYERLLNVDCIDDIQEEIADIMHSSLLTTKYDPLALAYAMLSLIEDSFEEMIADSAHANLILKFPQATPEELAEKVDQENQETYLRTLDIYTYIINKMSERQLYRKNNNEPYDKPSDNIVALCSVLRKVIESMLFQAKISVTYGGNLDDILIEDEIDSHSYN